MTRRIYAKPTLVRRNALPVMVAGLETKTIEN